MIRAWSLLISFLLSISSVAGIAEMAVRDAPIGKMTNLNIAGVVLKRFDNLYGRLHYRYNSLRHAPEEVYIGGYNQMGVANVHVEVGYDVVNKTLLGAAVIRAEGTTVETRADSKDKLTFLDIKQRVRIGGKKATINPSYDFKTRAMGLKTSLELDGKNTMTELEYDGLTQNYWLRLGHRIDRNNMIAPQLSLRTGDLKLAWVRTLGGQSQLETIVEPGKRVELKWMDPGYNGVWETSANIPWDTPSKSTVSFRRTWEL